MIGHPTVTKETYNKATKEQKLKAVSFSEASVNSGLSGSGIKNLTYEELLKLKAQIERDFLVFLISNEIY